MAQQRQLAGQFPVGSLNRVDELPDGRFRAQLENLPQAERDRALQWLRSFHFTQDDLPSLRADRDGGIFYVCPNRVEVAAAESSAPEIEEVAVPIDPFPPSLIFHSRPGAPNVLYINFGGEMVTNTQWNTEINRSVIPAVAFSTDSDFTTLSDAEQIAIKRIWQRMAEDYAPFNIDVTTERPVTFNMRTAMALITRNTDANGAANPYGSAGGVAYVNVFGISTYAKYRPAWIYHNNLANVESYIAEAASHEIGHNMGLSHDGKTDGAEYYGGHGSDEISWGPLMGTGYNRNVSQWSRGDYYLANNTQDDLATIAGKISYRTDDHGNTSGTATALVVSGGTNIVSTTPETDLANTNTVNKGVFERNTDLDVFSFITGSGRVRLEVGPWITPSGTRGGNLDVLVELHTEGGVRLLTSNPANQTGGWIDTNLSEGRYYLHVRNSGAGDPFNSTPLGYTAYGSIGQYFIRGFITEPTTIVVPPAAELQPVADMNQTGQTNKQFSVTYSDDIAINVSTIDASDIRVTGPNNYDQIARYVSIDSTLNGTPRVVNYEVSPAGGGNWSAAHNGMYTIFMRANEVRDTEGASVPASQLGQFTIAISTPVYVASMDSNPGWTLDPQWQYGAPNYSGNGPVSGYTGTSIIGYNLSGNYVNNLAAKYATTPPINCTGTSTLTLRFKRWLRTKVNDPVSIQVSTNGTTWLNVWSTSSAVSDTAWQEVQYALPASVAGSSSVRLRWSLASNQTQNDIGWNIDDVELLGDGVLDTLPPVAVLNVASLTSGGAPSHSCNVQYTDETAVRLSSLTSSNLLVTGPNGYSNLVEFMGADLPNDGSPITASYAIPAPDNSWKNEDNGTYTITLLENTVQDTLNNGVPQTILGTFEVAISAVGPGALAVSPLSGLTFSGTAGGAFHPATTLYILTNSGGSTLTWSAVATQPWLSLSAIGGSLVAGGITNVTVSINTNANTLPAGSYTDVVLFTDAATATTHSRNVQLIISSISLSVLDLGDQFQVSLLGAPLGTYVIEASANLAQWLGIQTNAADTNGHLIYIETNSAKMPVRFYRGRPSP